MREVTRGHCGLQSLQPVRGAVHPSGAAVQEVHPDLANLPVFGEEAGLAEQPDDGLPHVLAGQSVDDGVEQGVEHCDSQEVICLQEDFAAFNWTGEVQQEEAEEGQPAGDEDSQDDGDCFQQRHILLRLPVESFALWDRGQALGVGFDDAEDANVEHNDGHEDGAEDGDAKEDVAFGVEREDGGALLQPPKTVPPQNRQDAQEHRQHPAANNEGQHPALLVPLVRLHPHHGDMALYGDGQQADHRRSQRDEHTPFSKEIENGGHFQGDASRRHDVHHVGQACQQVRESQISQ